MSVLPEINWKRCGEEATQLLSELLQIDTTNPPGKERPAAEYLQRFFQKQGISSEILEKEPGRSNLLARLKGSKPGPKLMLLSHTDVVPATNPKSWKYPPFSGAVKEGYVWGRGALDMKSMTAMEAVAFALFRRMNLDFAGELMFLAVADEEKGGTYGAAWLAEVHKEKVYADYVINEGGGMPLEVNGKVFYTIETIEKGLWWVRVRVKGTAGHGSVPHEDNSLVKSARVIDRIAQHKFPKMISPSLQTFFQKVASALGPQGRTAVQSLLAEDSDIDVAALFDDKALNPYLVNAFIRTTCSPTMIQAGLKENVIPDSCEFVLDFRFVPGFSREKIQETLKAMAQELGMEMEIETLQFHDVSESPSNTDLYTIIEETIREELPGVEGIPYLMTGATDSRFLREIGCVAYGFQPLSTRMSLSERSRLIHNDNERIDTDSLELGVKWLTQVALKTLTARV
jgi:acetylornithine deacetylase/succinyl-diaminopimelate desuccinylase-like protein